jgi:hypothetical protein
MLYEQEKSSGGWKVQVLMVCERQSVDSGQLPTAGRNE